MKNVIWHEGWGYDVGYEEDIIEEGHWGEDTVGAGKGVDGEGSGWRMEWMRQNSLQYVRACHWLWPTSERSGDTKRQYGEIN